MTLNAKSEIIRRVLIRLAVVVLFFFAATTVEARRPMADSPRYGDTLAAECDSFTWYGTTYTESCDVQHTFAGAAFDGSDSIVTLHLVIFSSCATADSQTACDQFLWTANNAVYTRSSRSVAVLTNSDGCDSTVTLYLTINYSDTVDMDTGEVCLGAEYQWRDSILTESGTYSYTVPNDVGCDSLWQLTLIVHDTLDVTVDDTCAYKDLPWTYGDRVYQDSVRNDIFNLKSQYGCDSTVHYNLTVVWRCDAFLQFPTVVTPNGDGINDRFVIFNLVDEGCYPHNHLSIYNRWGWLMYDKENISEDEDFWSPETALPGTYFFHFEGYGFTDKVERNGSFEIIRQP